MALPLPQDGAKYLEQDAPQHKDQCGPESSDGRGVRPARMIGAVQVDTGCRLLDTGQVDPDRVECHFPRHDNLEIDIVSGTAPLGSGFFNRPSGAALDT